jgi:hypothetical protein
MLIKWGALVTAGSGKIGGQVVTSNRAGSVLRTKVTPTNAQTPAQTAARNLLSSISSSWKTLTQAQIALWNAAVSSYKKTNIFGDTVSPSGFNLYQALNNNLSRIGEAMLTTPPVPVSIPVITTGVLTATHAGAIIVTFTTDPSLTDSVMEVWATASMSPGKSYVKSDFRRIGRVASLAAHVATLTTMYNAKFGAVGAAGEKTFVQLVQTSSETGQQGTPVVYSAINL